jgi:hypothetical protein
LLSDTPYVFKIFIGNFVIEDQPAHHIDKTEGDIYQTVRRDLFSNGVRVGAGDSHSEKQNLTIQLIR